eukprot:83954_1
MTKRPLEDSDNAIPTAKKYKFDSRYCKYGCGRPVADGRTRNGNKYDTCCRNCALHHQNKNKGKKSSFKHSDECNQKLNSSLRKFNFKLLGKKTRDTPHHGGEDTSRKYICCIDDKYYYRIWKGINYNSYVLIHPLKYITNQFTLNKYMEAFDYEKHTTDDDNILNTTTKFKIISSIQKFNLSPSLSQFIANRLKGQNLSQDTAWNQPHDDIFVDGEVVLSGISFMCHKLRYKDVLKSNYVSPELYNSFPFSDIESRSSCILSNCSGDTTFDHEYELFKAMNEWLKQNGCDIIPDGFDHIDEIVNSNNNDCQLTEDYLYDLRRDMVHEYIYYNKLQSVFTNVKKIEIFRELNRNVEWNLEKQKPFAIAIQTGWKECNMDILNVLLMMIEPILTSDSLKERRLKFWKTKTKEIYDAIGQEACDKLREMQIKDK